MALFRDQQPIASELEVPFDFDQAHLWSTGLDYDVTRTLTKHASLVEFDHPESGMTPSAETGAHLHLRDRTIDSDQKLRIGEFMLDIYITAQAAVGPDATQPIVRQRPRPGSSEPLAEIILERVERIDSIELVDEACVYAIASDLTLQRTDVAFHDGTPYYLRFKRGTLEAISQDIEHMHYLYQLRTSGIDTMLVGDKETAYLVGLLALARDPREFDV